jgi:amidase
MYHTMFRGHGFGHNTFGVYPTSLIDAMGEAGKRVAEFPPTMRFGMLLGRWADKAYGGHFYAKAQNQRRALTAAYDRVLDGYDALLMPTTAMKTSRIPAPDAGFLEVMGHCWEMIGNPAPFNVSGHPSISIPCGLGAGERPVGLMLTASHFDEMMLYRIAHAFELSCDWQSVGATG